MSPPPAADSLLSRVTVVIPARDEEDALPLLLAGLREQGVGAVVVVDNGSRDATARVAREGGARVVREPQRGYGRACLTGLRELRAEAEGEGRLPPLAVLFMDGDRSDDPGEIPRVVDPVLASRAEMTVGVRVEGEKTVEEGEPGAWRARFGTDLILLLARWIHGLRARDLGPFRCVRWELLEAMAMDDETWGWTLQMQLRAHHLGARVVEVEIQRRPRAAGESKVSGSLAMAVRVGGRMMATLIREWRLRSGFRARAPFRPGS